MQEIKQTVTDTQKWVAPQPGIRNTDLLLSGKAMVV